MRILRGKSNLEVSSHGFALFVVGLILATFVGGAVRTLLGSERVHERIVLELRNRFPNQDIKIGATEVLLSRGIWPALGLKVYGIALKQEVCGRLSFQLDVPTAILPVNIWSLRSGRPRLGNIELEKGKIHFDYKPCPTAEVQPSTAQKSPAVKPTLPIIANLPPPPEWHPPRFEWKQWGRALDGVELNDFAVTYENNPTWKLQLRFAQLDFSHEFDGRASVEVQKSLPFGSLVHLVEMEAHSDKSVLQWTVNSEFKEGRVNWKGSWDTASHAAVSTVDVSQFPIKEVLTELFQMGLLEREVQMKATWVSCNAGWEGNLQHPHENPLKLQFCKLEGAYGGMQVEKAELFPLYGDLLKVPVEFRVQNLQVQPIVEALNRQVLPTVINKLGVWSGQFKYLNKNSWSLNGNLSGAEIVFSNQSVRGKQSIRLIHTMAEKVEGLVAAKVDQVEMNDGQFLGLVEFNLNDDWRSGTFRTNIQNLTLSPSIQALLTGGGWNDLRLAGSGMLQNGELSDWKGTIESTKIYGEGWAGEGVQIQGRYAPGVFTLEGHVDRMDLNSQWRYFATVRERLSSESNQIGVKDVRSKVEVKKSGGEILSFTAVEESTGKPWRGRGSWQRDRELVAALTGAVGGKAKTFAIRAEKGLLTIDENTAAAR